MTTVLLVIHLMIAAALVGVVLIQRSEGGALGIGGGGGGNFMTGRGKANLLTRATAILATGFFLTSLLLSILAGSGRPTSILDQLNQQGSGTTETSGSTTSGETSTGGTTSGTTDSGSTSGTGTTTPSAPQSQ